MKQAFTSLVWMAFASPLSLRRYIFTLCFVFPPPPPVCVCVCDVHEYCMFLGIYTLCVCVCVCVCVRAFRPDSSLLVSALRGEAGGEWAADGPFFRLEPSEHSNGCFLAVLTREVSHTHTHTHGAPCCSAHNSCNCISCHTFGVTAYIRTSAPSEDTAREGSP